MDAVEFVKARRCMLKQTCRAIDLYNDYINPEDVVAETEKWAKEHPAKTRQGEFLKIYPNAFVDKGVLGMCPMSIDNSLYDIGDFCKHDFLACFDCRREFWLKEIE